MINDLAQHDPASLIGKGEHYYHRNVNDAVDYIYENRMSIRIILLAGPSSSGKTTTALNIGRRLAEKGVHAPVISLDNFYRNRNEIPYDQDGQQDLETVEALDIPKINSCFEELIETGKSDFPIFDFKRSERSEEVQHIELGEQDLIIMEGIHALNPRLTQRVANKGLFRIYISVLTDLVDGEEIILHHKDCRLMRRIIRDEQHRGASMTETLGMWNKVCAGEEKYIHPFKNTADMMIDSIHYYEPCIYHHYLLPMIDEVERGSSYYEKAQQLKKILDSYWDLDKSWVPADSLLQEFVG